jgi:hypothetical protein
MIMKRNGAGECHADIGVDANSLELSFWLTGVPVWVALRQGAP